MKIFKIISVRLLTTAFAVTATLGMGAEESMDKMWGDSKPKATQTDLTRGPHLREGRYGLFIHWGLYSSLAGKWNEKTHYGIGEWIKSMARIPVPDYMEVARSFNPDQFNAKAIVQMAKDAGMKYIIITSKHHEGFAMFKSKHPFNIVDATPFHRDPMEELSAACREAGLGFGFYYSHFQDWTAPGGSGGPKKNEDGSDATFDQYFKEKCYPQVKEICTQYGPLDVIWFDTPGDMPEKDVVALHDLVRSTQPKALIASRIGYGMGDYACLGDMEVPPEKIDGFWESCDTTNDSWAFVWYDTNWKAPGAIVKRLVSTVARGGNYLLNVGPDGKGNVPEQCQKFLIEAGAWIKANPTVIYGAGPSPWRYAMPWGDITTSGTGQLNLVVFDRPQDGFLYLPGLSTPIKSASLLQNGKVITVMHEVLGDSVRIKLPDGCRDSVALVVHVELRGAPEVDQSVAVHPNTSNEIFVHFAEASGAEKKNVSWPEKFGEWKHATQISKWTPGASARWKVNVLQAGPYHATLKYRGKSADKTRVVWKITTDEGAMIQNEQSATSQYQFYPMGVFKIRT
ncbi:MAG: alpha-L-fucosidase, partial [Verrucomicrobiota bacterium]